MFFTLRDVDGLGGNLRQNSWLHIYFMPFVEVIIPVTHSFQYFMFFMAVITPSYDMYFKIFQAIYRAGSPMSLPHGFSQISIRGPPASRPIAFIFAAWSGLSLAFRQLIRWVSWRLEGRPSNSGGGSTGSVGESWETH